MATYKSDNIKQHFLDMLVKTRGIISGACQAVNISRQTYYQWLKDDPEFAKSVEEINEGCIDWVESKLHEKINGVSVIRYTQKGEEDIYEQPPSDTAIIFYLKTKAKKRGYIEKNEVGFTDKDGNDVEPTQIVFTKQ